VTPLLAETLNATAASIDDSLVWHTSSLERISEDVDVALLVVALVVLAVGGVFEFTRGLGPRVPSSNVGRDTADLGWGASSLVNLGELLSTGL
jgi:hypothetical protein